MKIVVCAGKMCVKYNGETAIEALAESLRRETERLADRQVEVTFGKCMRSCRKGCIITTQPDMKKYTKVTPDQVKDIINAALEDVPQFIAAN